MSDDDLLEAISRGEGTALAQLYDRHALTVERIARQLIRDEQRVQDIVQEVFARIWTTGARRYTAINFHSWLYVLVRRIALDFLRHEQRRPQTFVADVELLAHTVGEHAQGAGWEGMSSLKLDLLHALGDLPEEQRLILKMTYFSGFTLKETASLLDIPLGTVKTRLHQGLLRLRGIMSDWERGDTHESGRR